MSWLYFYYVYFDFNLSFLMIPGLPVIKIGWFLLLKCHLFILWNLRIFWRRSIAVMKMNLLPTFSIFHCFYLIFCWRFSCFQRTFSIIFIFHLYWIVRFRSFVSWIELQQLLASFFPLIHGRCFVWLSSAWMYGRGNIGLTSNRGNAGNWCFFLMFRDNDRFLWFFVLLLFFWFTVTTTHTNQKAIEI